MKRDLSETENEGVDSIQLAIHRAQSIWVLLPPSPACTGALKSSSGHNTFAGIGMATDVDWLHCGVTGNNKSVNECRQYIVVYIASSSLGSVCMVLVYRDQKVSSVDVMCTLFF
jgi:hypothetical protein